jgi:hypothetical protein
MITFSYVLCQVKSFAEHSFEAEESIYPWKRPFSAYTEAYDTKQHEIGEDL